MEEVTIIEIIKGMLSPGIMISACGLLLLGMNNKYSMVVNRIRSLNSEFRELEFDHEERKENIRVQLPLLMKRMKLIRNAVWFYTLAIAMFIFSVFALGVVFIYPGTELAKAVSLFVFIVGLMSVLIGVIYAAREVLLAFQILKIESKGIH